MLFAVTVPVNVGLPANTFAPVPVSSVNAAAKLALDGVAKNVATLAPNPEIPVDTGSPVAFVNVTLVGVPNIGVTNVGLVLITTLPVPVIAFDTNVSFASVNTAWFALKPLIVAFDAVRFVPTDNPLVIDTVIPLSVICESEMCSNPPPFNTLFWVNNVSLPTLLNVGGPTSNTEDVTPPAVFWWTNIHWSLIESKYNEPLRSGDEPESITSIPPNLTPGVLVFIVILFVPTFKVLCEI